MTARRARGLVLVSLLPGVLAVAALCAVCVEARRRASAAGALHADARCAASLEQEARGALDDWLVHSSPTAVCDPETGGVEIVHDTWAAGARRCRLRIVAFDPSELRACRSGSPGEFLARWHAPPVMYGSSRLVESSGTPWRSPGTPWKTPERLLPPADDLLGGRAPARSAERLNINTAPLRSLEHALGRDARWRADLVRARRARVPLARPPVVLPGGPALVTTSAEWVVLVEIEAGSVLRRSWLRYEHRGARWSCVGYSDG